MDEDNIFFCKTDIKIKLYTIKKGKDNYLFLKSNISTIETINKMNDNLSSSTPILNNISDEELTTLLKYLQKMSDINLKKLKNILSETTHIIDDWINADDTIYNVLHKIAIYCYKGIIGDYIYAWYYKKGETYPLAFTYDKLITNPIDDNQVDTSFVNNDGTPYVPPSLRR